MSINPVSAPSAPAEMPGATAHRLASPATAPPISGRAPKQETAAVQDNSFTPKLHKGEVEVQRDMQSGGKIVVRYMDSSGDLILQIPTEQVLGIARAIDQDLEREQATGPASRNGPQKESTRGH